MCIGCSLVVPALVGRCCLDDKRADAWSRLIRHASCLGRPFTADGYKDVFLFIMQLQAALQVGADLTRSSSWAGSWLGVLVRPSSRLQVRGHSSITVWLLMTPG